MNTQKNSILNDDYIQQLIDFTPENKIIEFFTKQNFTSIQKENLMLFTFNSSSITSLYLVDHRGIKSIEFVNKEKTEKGMSERELIINFDDKFFFMNKQKIGGIKRDNTNNRTLKIYLKNNSDKYEYLDAFISLCKANGIKINDLTKY